MFHISMRLLRLVSITTPRFHGLQFSIGFKLDRLAFPRYLHFLPFFAITVRDRDVNNFLPVLYCSCNSLLLFHFYALMKRDTFLLKRWQKIVSVIKVCLTN